MKPSLLFFKFYLQLAIQSTALLLELASTRHELNLSLRPSVRIVLFYAAFAARGSEVSFSPRGTPNITSLSKSRVADVYRRVYFNYSKFSGLRALPGRPIPRESAV